MEDQTGKAIYQRSLKTDFARRLAHYMPHDVTIDEVVVPDDGVYLTFKRSGHTFKCFNAYGITWLNGDYEMKAEAIRRKLGVQNNVLQKSFRKNDQWKANVTVVRR